jgi:hypothetical protein
MGERAAAIFDRAGASLGLVGKMRLASVARLTSSEAAALPDSRELLARLESALGSLQGTVSLPDDDADPPSTVVPPRANTDHTALLRRQLAVCVELFGQRALFLGQLEATASRITESAAATLGVARASVWLREDDGQALRCVDLFERDKGTHSAGIVLKAEDFGSYFEALGSERTIAANDAHTDPRTACFSESYLTPLGIGSMLDVPIWAKGEMVGVLCHEHIGGAREWNSDEETFAFLLAGFVSLCLERSASLPAPRASLASISVAPETPSSAPAPPEGVTDQRQ